MGAGQRRVSAIALAVASALALVSGALACSKETFQGASVDAAAADAPTLDDAAPAAVADAATCAPDASFAFDDENCGRCGRSCLGGKCIESHCTPVELGTVASPAGFWVDDALWMTSYAGDTPGLYRSDKAVPSFQRVVDQAGAWELVGHGGTVSWTNWNGADNGGGVYRLSGSSAVTLTTAQSPREIVADAVGLYFVDNYENAISALLDGVGGTTVIATPIVERRTAISVDDGYAYWAEVGAHRIAAAPKRGGGAVRTVVDTTEVVTSTLVVGDRLYVASEVRDGLGTCGGGHVVRFPLGADAGVGAPEPIADGACPEWLSAAGDYVYWTEQTPNGSVRRAHRATNAVEPVVTDVPNPTHVRVDGAVAYFYEEPTGKVRRVALP